MPFISSNLYISRGSFNQSVGLDNAGLNTYISDEDTFAEILTTGYFPDNFGVAEGRVQVNDLLFIKDKTDNYLSYRITELSPVGLVQDNVSGNPFDQSLNTTNLVTFIGTTLTPQIANPGSTYTLWINSMDGHLYRGSVDVELATGDVNGPASSTDNAFVRFDGATGNVIQNSSATLDDAGAATFVGNVSLDTDVYWDNEVLNPGNVIFSFDLNDYFVFNKATNLLAYYVGAVEKFRFENTGELKASYGVDTIGASPLEIGATNATVVNVTPPISGAAITGTSITGTLFTDTSLAGGGTTPAQINNSGEIERGSAQKTVYFNLNYGSNSSNYRTRSISSTGAFNMTFAIPPDFNSIVNLVAVGWPNSGAAGTGKDIDLTSSYCAIGEDIDTHSESDLTSTYDTGTTNVAFELDLSGVFTAVSAGDICGINIDHQGIGGTIDYIHIRLDYI